MKASPIFKLENDAEKSSVGDPWLFGADPDHRIRTSDYWIRNRFQLIFFSYNSPTGTSSSVLKFNFVPKFYFASIISFRSTHLWERGRIRRRIRKAQKRANPVLDPDPQHWKKEWSCIVSFPFYQGAWRGWSLCWLSPMVGSGPSGCPLARYTDCSTRLKVQPPPKKKNINNCLFYDSLTKWIPVFWIPLSTYFCLYCSGSFTNFLALL